MPFMPVNEQLMVMIPHVILLTFLISSLSTPSISGLVASLHKFGMMDS